MESNQDIKVRTMQRLQRYVDALPLLPATVVALMELNPDDDDYFERVYEKASGEQTFAARLLGYANSAAIAPRQPITTLSEAFRRVGAKKAVNLVVAHAAAQAIPARL